MSSSPLYDTGPSPRIAMPPSIASSNSPTLSNIPVTIDLMTPKRLTFAGGEIYIGVLNVNVPTSISLSVPTGILLLLQEILSKFTDEETDKTGPMFIEQFLLFHYLKNHGVDLGYFAHGYINPTEINYSLVSHRFLHLMDYHKDELINDKVNYISKMYNITL